MSNVTSPSAIPHVQIRAGVPGPLVDIPELLRFRDLLWTLADRDLRVRYKQTALGVIWVVLQPLMSSLIFAFVFGVIAAMPSDGKPYLLFAFAGMTAWNTFSNVLMRVSGSLVGNAQMLSKIYFPRLILPLSSAISALVDSAFSLGLMFVMLVLYRVWPGWGIVLLPVWLVILMVLALGLGLMTASWMVTYRDVVHVIPVVLSTRPVHQPGGLVVGEPEPQREIPLDAPVESALQSHRSDPVVTTGRGRPRAAGAGLLDRRGGRGILDGSDGLQETGAKFRRCHLTTLPFQPAV